VFRNERHPNGERVIPPAFAATAETMILALSIRIARTLEGPDTIKANAFAPPGHRPAAPARTTG
jgi:hypothetical protein